jgi:heptosyltransferase I
VAAHILLVKLSSLGDVIQTMPVVQDILHHQPQAQIDWVVEEAFAPLVLRVRGLRQVIPIAQRRWRHLSRASASPERRAFLHRLQADAYDVVLDLQGLIKSAWVARQARLKPGGFSATYGNKSEACGYEWPVRFMLTRSVPMPRRIHAVARYRLLAGQALGYPVQGPGSYAWTGRTAPGHQATDGARRTVVLAHGTTRPDNEWPRGHWQALARRLVDEGFHIAIPQANDVEEAWAHRLTAELDVGTRAQVWPRQSLAQVLDAMAAAQGVVGVDSGLSHMAVALGLPHVQIFSQDRAWRAGPLGQDQGGVAHQVSVGGAQAPDVDAVWQAWQAVWASRCA